MQIKRGEIYWVDFEPVKGSEQGGLRPALVVQNDVGNKYSSTTVVVAITRTLPPKPYPFIVVIEPHDSGLPFRSAVNCSQMVTIQQFGSESRFRPIPGDSEVRPVGQLPQAKMEEVNMAILYNLDL